MENQWTTKRILLLVFASITFWMGLQHLNLVLGFITGILSLATPLILGFCIAFMMNVLMVPIEGTLKGKRIKAYARPLALLLSLIIVVLAIGVLLLLVIPAFTQAIEDIVENLPGLWSKFQNYVAVQLEALPFDIANLPDLDIDWQAISNWLGGFLSVGSSTVFNATLGITSKVMGGALNLLLGLVFAIYGLLQKEQLKVQFKKLLYAILPIKFVEKIIDTGVLAESVFSNFIRGQLTEALVIGVLCFIGMIIFQIPHALVVSALVGTTALIPIFGAIIGTAMGMFLIVMVAPIKAIWFLVFIIVLQQLESNLIYPKVVGGSIGLPGIWVLAAVTIGAGAFGILGMLIGVPLSSLIYALLKQWVNTRLKTKKIAIK